MWLVTALQALAVAWVVAALWRVALPGRGRWGRGGGGGDRHAAHPARLLHRLRHARHLRRGRRGRRRAAADLPRPHRPRPNTGGWRRCSSSRSRSTRRTSCWRSCWSRSAGRYCSSSGVERRAIVRRLGLFVGADRARRRGEQRLRHRHPADHRRTPCATSRSSPRACSPMGRGAITCTTPARPARHTRCAVSRGSRSPIRRTSCGPTCRRPGSSCSADYPTRVKLEDQEGRFVLGTLAYAPVAQLGASLRNWARQMGMVFVDDPVRDPAFYLTDPYWRQTNLPPMIARVEACGPHHNLCRSRLTVAASKLWHGAGGGDRGGGRARPAALAAAAGRRTAASPARRGGGVPARRGRRQCRGLRHPVGAVRALSGADRLAGPARRAAPRRGPQGNKTRENRRPPRNPATPIG